MSSPEEFDLFVLGSGAPGKLLSWALASRGQRVIVVERKYIGGSCPNIACLPSKNIIHAAKVASLLFRRAEFGIHAGNPGIDMAAVRERKRTMVQGLVQLHLEKYRASGAHLVMGTGRFTAPRTIEVALPEGGTRLLRGKQVLVNTGSRAKLDPVEGMRDANPLTHIEALELERVPGHLLVLGGGYVGLELAQAFRRFGSEVTIIDRNAALLHREDPDVSEGLTRRFEEEGIRISLNTVLQRVTGTSGRGVQLRAKRDGMDAVIEGTHLLVAAGRTPNTDKIGLEAAGIERDSRGFVKVDERLRTTAEGVWAAGDCAGSPQFTHIAEDDYRVLLANMTGGDRVTTGRQVPSCVFTDPELARIGLNEREAKAHGIAYRLAKIPMSHVLRARTVSEERGFMKALVAADSDRILGFTGFGAEAGEVLAAVQVAMAANLPYTALRDMILTHPTMAEGLNGLFGAVPERA